MATKDEIKKRIVLRLVRWRKWGGSHTENVIGGLPRHLRGTRLAKQVLRELVRDKWLIAAVKTGETHFALNPNKAEEIKKFCEEYLVN